MLLAGLSASMSICRPDRNSLENCVLSRSTTRRENKVRRHWKSAKKLIFGAMFSPFLKPSGT